LSLLTNSIDFLKNNLAFNNKNEPHDISRDESLEIHTPYNFGKVNNKNELKSGKWKDNGLQVSNSLLIFK